MPGKRKKDRKNPKAGKGTKKFGTPDRGNHNGQGAKVQPRGPKNDTKVFTLKDEAAKSTFRSSKRLWQGEGTKLRNLPVEFVRALENYDPGQYLRDQIEANAKKQLSLTEPAGEHDNSTEPDKRPLDLLDMSSILRSNSFEAKAQDESASALEEEQHPTHVLAEVEAQSDPSSSASYFKDEENRNLISTSVRLETATEPVATSTILDHLDHDVTSAVGDLRLDTSSPQTSTPRSEPSMTSHIDVVLQNLRNRDDYEIDETEDVEEPASPTAITEPQSTVIKDVNMSMAETPSSTDAELFVVDVQGESVIADEDLPDIDEVLLFRPKEQMPAATKDSVLSTTPWARTIDDPVLIDELDQSTSSPSHFVAAFESGTRSQRGKRGGAKKKQKQKEAVQSRRQDEVDIMFDYMENANWTDESDADEYTDDAEPLINQLLSDVRPTDELSELPGLGSENGESPSSEEESEDDTDIDDDLALMIDAEMEEMEFDLGYSGGRSGKGARYGADRELVDSALYHEDFNVYQYNSASGESSDELAASGGRKRGLNKFIDDLDLSDEELEASLIAQWKKDRGSKKAKKQERQRQHQAGVIGKKAKRARMSHEVDTRSSGELEGYHIHIKRFVSHADYAGIEELPMPAMDKAVRRAVHVLSQAYGLKSASQGSGKRRHITLYKTKHSAQLPDPDYLEETLFRAKRSLGFNSKYRDTLLPEAAQRKLGRSGKPMRSGRDGGGAGGRLRDGDLVGADAPEIAIANRGRQMLEKLGWLHGSGLGAVGKEGINLPLFATIKNSKHGLQ